MPANKRAIKKTIELYGEKGMFTIYIKWEEESNCVCLHVYYNEESHFTEVSLATI